MSTPCLLPSCPEHPNTGCLAHETDLDRNVDGLTEQRSKQPSDGGPRKCCSECHIIQTEAAFHKMQWIREDEQHVCRNCLRTRAMQGLPVRCNCCGAWKNTSAFPTYTKHYAYLTKKRCIECSENNMEMRQCRGACGRYLPRTEFTVIQWEKAGQKAMTAGKCTRCTVRHFRTRSCSTCEQQVPRSGFTTRAWNQADDSKRRCRQCQKRRKGVKRCPRCKEEKPIHDFCTARKHCIECRRKWQRMSTQRCSRCRVYKPRPLFRTLTRLEKWGMVRARKPHICTDCREKMQEVRQRIAKDKEKLEGNISRSMK